MHADFEQWVMESFSHKEDPSLTDLVNLLGLVKSNPVRNQDLPYIGGSEINCSTLIGYLPEADPSLIVLTNGDEITVDGTDGSHRVFKLTRLA